ncbi:hypothetical protein I312_106099 [Cryptococcus bacillisporus CA1280]|uniref:uncharacterized protein n=1 Tax=Cryptococcus bacillisporus CA1280 TaxID=1296109 RepID=UPI003366710E
MVFMSGTSRKRSKAGITTNSLTSCCKKMQEGYNWLSRRIINEAIKISTTRHAYASIFDPWIGRILSLVFTLTRV